MNTTVTTQPETMMSTTISYAAIDDSSDYVHGAWTGDRAMAVEAGVDALHAERSEDGRYRYHDDATAADYLVREDDIAKLGAALLIGYTLGQSYSVWCSETDSEEAPSTDDTDARTLLDAYETDDTIRLVARKVLGGRATPDEVEAVADLAEAVRDETDANGELINGQDSSERIGRLERVLRDSIGMGSSDDEDA